MTKHHCRSWSDGLCDSCGAPYTRCALCGREADGEREHAGCRKTADQAKLRAWISNSTYEVVDMPDAQEITQ